MVRDIKSFEKTNLGEAMSRVYISNYQKFYDWSITKRQDFWRLTTKLMGIVYDKRYDKFLDLRDGIENPHWLMGAKLNIAKSCFTSPKDAIAIKFQENADQPVKEITYQQLKTFSNRVANSLKHEGIKPGDAIAINMPMTAESVAIYIGAILSGAQVVTVADSFAEEEIKVRFDIVKPKLVFTQDVITRAAKIHNHYLKVQSASTCKCIVIPEGDSLQAELKQEDEAWSLFISKESLLSVFCRS